MYVTDGCQYTSHVIHMNESCHTFEWVMSHFWMSRAFICRTRVWAHTSCVAHMNESWRTCESGTSHILKSGVNTRQQQVPAHKSYHIHEWVMAHISLSHGTRMHVSMSRDNTCQQQVPARKSYRIHAWVTSNIFMSHGTHRYESCHTYIWDIVFIWICTEELEFLDLVDCGVVAFYVESAIYEWFKLHICMSHVTHMNESCHTYEWVMSHIWMSRVYICHRRMLGHKLRVAHSSKSGRSYEQILYLNESCRI